MTDPDVDAAGVAAMLDRAHRDGTLLDATSIEIGNRDAAYAVQRELTARRLARGQTVIGYKLGYTSEVMRVQMGISEPNRGPLLSGMLLGDEPLMLTQPRVEPEIAMVLGADLIGSPSVPEVIAACREARCALEVVDSVWSGYRFDLEHNTADGSSAAGLVLGPRLRLEGLEAVEVELCVNGVVVGRGRGSDAMGHPAAAVAWLADVMTRRGESLCEGDVVITGGLTAAWPASVDSTAKGASISAVFHTDAAAAEVAAPAWLRA